MNEYITKSSAVNVLSAYGNYSLEDAERIVKRNCAPAADVVAVVRCNDCADYEPVKMANGKNAPIGYCKEWERFTEHDGYCYCGIK